MRGDGSRRRSKNDFLRSTTRTRRLSRKSQRMFRIGSISPFLKCKENERDRASKSWQLNRLLVILFPNVLRKEGRNEQVSSSIHAHRVVGGHCHHRHPDRPSCAGCTKSSRSGRSHSV